MASKGHLITVLGREWKSSRLAVRMVYVPVFCCYLVFILLLFRLILIYGFPFHTPFIKLGVQSVNRSNQDAVQGSLVSSREMVHMGHTINLFLFLPSFFFRMHASSYLSASTQWISMNKRFFSHFRCRCRFSFEIFFADINPFGAPYSIAMNNTNTRMHRLEKTITSEGKDHAKTPTAICIQYQRKW